MIAHFGRPARIGSGYIAADPKHLGAPIGLTLVLHTWGSAMTYHPHVHRIVPGGGLSSDGERWIACRPGFFLPVRVLSRLYRRRFCEQLIANAHRIENLAWARAHITDSLDGGEEIDASESGTGLCDAAGTEEQSSPFACP